MPPVTIACLVAHSVVAHLAANRNRKIALKYMRMYSASREMNVYMADIIVNNEIKIDQFDAIALNAISEKIKNS